MSGSFVHLHVHTQYSLLEGSLRIDDLIERAKSFNMPAVAITDSNNLFGGIDFYLSAKKAGLKPILGCELYFAPQGRLESLRSARTGGSGGGNFSDNITPKFFHLPVLCINLQGYQNLCQILTRAYTEAPEIEKGDKSSLPRALVDRDLLSRYSEGLIALSGCIKSEISHLALGGDEQALENATTWYQKTFKDNFYFELQDSALPEQELINERLYDLGKKKNIPCLASSDCHYLDPEDAEAHEVLQCIEMNKNLDLERVNSLVPKQYYFKSPEKMRARFERFPGACDETLKIAEKCNLDFEFTDAQGRAIYHLPEFRPTGYQEGSFDSELYFRELSAKGLRERFVEPGFQEKTTAPDWPQKRLEYERRLEDEISMILKTGFAGYFLIVADFINWAKKQQIPVGPGRGSGAGSLVAYSLKITDIDPIEFNLLFERFINPERVSMPDFDVDFCQERRGEVIKYVMDKYGQENVSQIITFGKLQARAVIKDVGRVFGFSFSETDQITKLIPTELSITIDRALEKEPRLQELMQVDARVKKIIEYAKRLEGLYRNAGVHAAGVIITEKPIVSYCPLFVAKEGGVVTQYDKDFAEKIGLVKFDFLGLKTLTVIDQAVQIVRTTAAPNSAEQSFDIRRISYKDSKVFALISSADTDGVFQVESSGMKDLCARLQPNSVEDLTAINALYRPGPLGSGMVDTFIECKHGRMPIEYELPILEPILKDTYGVILYQEQVMQIARNLAGYSLGQADMLRRAMGKKKPEEMAKHREIFISGALKQAIPARIAETIFDKMAKFAEYGFNKSHSAAYAILTYQTAYLKAYFPAEFMAALMTTEMSNTDKLAKYIGDARDHHLSVLPPHVNLSQRKFSVETLEDGRTKAIRFGLEAIKGVGGIAVDILMEERAKKPFENVLDFCRRVPTRKVNKKVLESLTYAGAFDEIAEVNRPTLLNSLEALIEYATDEQEERELGQSSLFDSFSAEEVKLVTSRDAIFKMQEDWPQSQKLLQEKQVVGFYVSGHPMDTWQSLCDTWLGWNTIKIRQYGEARAANVQNREGQNSYVPGYGVAKKQIKVAGVIVSLKEITTKKGKRMAFGQFEDLRGSLELILFPDSFLSLSGRAQEAMRMAEPVIIEGELELRDETPKIIVTAIEWVKEAQQNRPQQVILKLKPSEVSREQLRELKKSLLEFRGSCPVKIQFDDGGFATDLTLPPELQVARTSELVTKIKGIFGRDVVHFQ